MPAALALRWLNEAANGGVRYQRFIESGNPRLRGNGVRAETFAAVEAALFRGRGRAIMIVQNATGEARIWRIKPDLKLGTPSQAERMSMPDLTVAAPHARAEAVTVAPALAIRIPPYSVTRVVWNAP